MTQQTITEDQASQLDEKHNDAEVLAELLAGRSATVLG